MTQFIQDSRLRIKGSDISGATFTVITGSTNHTDGTWTNFDLYDREIACNTFDKKIYVRLGEEIVELQTSATTNTDTYVTGGTVTGGTSIVLTRNDNVDIDINVSSISGLTDTYVTGGTLNGTVLELTRNDDVTVSSELSALTTSSLSWSAITSTPTTFEGYVITGGSVNNIYATTISAATISATTYYNLPPSVTAFSALTDVNVTAATDGDLIVFTADTWTSQTPETVLAGSDLTINTLSATSITATSIATSISTLIGVDMTTTATTKPFQNYDSLSLSGDSFVKLEDASYKPSRIRTIVSAGTTTIATIVSADPTQDFYEFKYSVISGINRICGTLTLMTNGSNDVNWSESGVVSFGDTSDFEFDFTATGSTIELKAVTTGTYSVTLHRFDYVTGLNE